MPTSSSGEKESATVKVKTAVTNPRIITINRTERYKVAAYCWVEIDATISGEFSNRREGLTELHKDLKAYHSNARKELHAAFDAGEFEWLADVD